METKNVLSGIISLTVAVICVAAIMMPVLNDATTTEATFTNEGLWRMKEIETDDVWTYTGSSTTWTLNDEELDVTSSGSNALLGDSWCIRSNGQLRGTTAAGNLITTIEATASEDTITITGNGLSGNSSQPLPGYGASLDGDYILTKSGNMSAYVNGDSVLYGTGSTGVDSVYMICHVTATVDGGITFTAGSTYNGTEISNVVFSNETINYTAVDGYEDLYVVTSLTADVSFDTVANDVTTTHTGSITYDSIIAPYEVTAELSQHLASGEIALLNVIPVLIIVSIVIAAVGLTITTRRD